MTTIAGQIVGPTTISAASGTIGPFQPPGNRPFNVFIVISAAANVDIQKSYDGTNFYTVVSAEFNGAATFNVSTAVVITETDPAVLYRLNVADNTGTVTGRLG
jgi:hypothetical protein